MVREKIAFVFFLTRDFYQIRFTCRNDHYKVNFRTTEFIANARSGKFPIPYSGGNIIKLIQPEWATVLSLFEYASYFEVIYGNLKTLTKLFFGSVKMIKNVLQCSTYEYISV